MVNKLERQLAELKQQVDLFRESETRYRTLFEEAGDGIFILQGATIVDCNQKTLALFGCGADQLIGKTPVDFSPLAQPNGKASEHEGWRRISAAMDGEDQYFEWIHMRPDGRCFDSEVSLKRIELGSGTFLQGIMRDITVRKRAQRELEKLKERLHNENLFLREEIRTEHNFDEMIGKSPALKKVISDIGKVAPTDANVLILGETGTGKELVARAVHGISRRRERPLVKVSCAALTPALIESELFGHEKGAFTGALARRAGRFELADGGTIFLDEIGELPLELQAKLLRVLQEGEFERVGGTKTLGLNVRIMAATNRDLRKTAGKGEFREDLYYRLNVFPILVPPLRKRKGDIPLLTRHFIQKHAPRIGKHPEKVSKKAMASLEAYDWPGNIRELENTIERAMIISPGDRLEFGDWLPAQPAAGKSAGIAPLEQVEKCHILKALEKTRGRVSGDKGAARILGLNPHTLFSRMKKLGISRQSVFIDISQI